MQQPKTGISESWDTRDRKTNVTPEKIFVRRLISFWEGQFSGAMQVSGRVIAKHQNQLCWSKIYVHGRTPSNPSSILQVSSVLGSGDNTGSTIFSYVSPGRRFHICKWRLFQSHSNKCHIIHNTSFPNNPCQHQAHLQHLTDYEQSKSYHVSKGCFFLRHQCYSFSHNHGSVENDCVWKVTTIGGGHFSFPWLWEEG